MEIENIYRYHKYNKFDNDKKSNNDTCNNDIDDNICLSYNHYCFFLLRYDIFHYINIHNNGYDIICDNNNNDNNKDNNNKTFEDEDTRKGRKRSGEYTKGEVVKYLLENERTRWPFSGNNVGWEPYTKVHQSYITSIYFFVRLIWIIRLHYFS